MKKATIVIPTYNSTQFIEKCLSSVFAQEFDDFDVMVIDNNSLDHSVQLLKKFPVQVLEMNKNYGWAGGNNIALRETKTPYVALLNIDTIVDKMWLHQLIELADSNPQVGAVSSTILEYGDYPKIVSGYPLFFDIESGLIVVATPTNEDKVVSFVPGTAMLLNLETLGAEAYFREDFFMYHEDVEFSLRVLSRLKCKLMFSGKSVVWHDSKQSFSNPLTCNLAIRNLFWCLTKYQTRREYISSLTNYTIQFARLYPFYRQFYPLRYPLAILKNMLYSVGILMKKNDCSSVRNLLEEVNQPVRDVQSFNFVF